MRIFKFFIQSDEIYTLCDQAPNSLVKTTLVFFTVDICVCIYMINMQSINVCTTTKQIPNMDKQKRRRGEGEWWWW